MTSVQVAAGDATRNWFFDHGPLIGYLCDSAIEENFTKFEDI
jgi:hypothetical protein